MRIRSLVVMVSSAMLVSALGAAPAVAADPVDTSVRESVDTWQQAADTLGVAGSLWSPSFTAGLRLRGEIDVVGDGITVRRGAVTGGETFAGADYRAGRDRRLTIVQRWAQTQWAADPATDIRRVPVGRVMISLGEPGTQVRVPAMIYANCYTQALSGNAPAPAPSLRCSRADVRRHGGTLTMTARPASTMTGPGRTTLQIDTTGLTYRQLLRVASSLQQVAPTPSVAGSAQMRGMCAQMVEGAMSLDQAGAFAQASGYTVRPGTVDGQPLAVTTDYRPDRFTVTLARGAVTACTYG